MARIHASVREDATRHLPTQCRGAELPLVLPRRDELEPTGQRFRGRKPLFRRPNARYRRSPGARWPRAGGAERAPVRRLARGLLVYRSAWAVRDLRRLCHGLGIDDRAAHEVAPGGGAPALASARCLTECSAHLDV